MLERILVPLDGSSRAELVLSQIERLLQRKDSTILLLRVVPWAAGDNQREQEEAEKYLHERIRRYSGHGARIGGRVVSGMIAEEILQAAEREAATMIAMTTHGRRGLSRWLLGSVAEKVARASAVPVLLVRSFRPGGEEVPTAAAASPFGKILVPTDGSSAAEAATAPARELAQIFESEMTVLHVVFPFIAPGPELGTFPAPALTAPQSDDATAGIAETFRGAGLRVTRKTEFGDPGSVILDQSQAPGTDLIVMASHGRSGLSRWVLGSVTEQVLRHGSVPLLIVPIRASGKAAPG